MDYIPPNLPYYNALPGDDTGRWNKKLGEGWFKEIERHPDRRPSSGLWSVMPRVDEPGFDITIEVRGLGVLVMDAIGSPITGKLIPQSARSFTSTQLQFADEPLLLREEFPDHAHQLPIRHPAGHNRAALADSQLQNRDHAVSRVEDDGA